MITHLQDTVMLNNGVKMPGFGLGVYKVEDGDITVASVKAAMSAQGQTRTVLMSSV